MAAARAKYHALDRFVRLVGAIALAGLSAGCAGGLDPGYAVVTQDRFESMECPQIIGERNNLTAREKQLSELAQKAESSPGGIIVSAAAYGSELTQARTSLRLARQAALQKGCDAKKP